MKEDKGNLQCLRQAQANEVRERESQWGSLKVEKPANLEGLEFKTGLSALTNMLKARSAPW